MFGDDRGDDGAAGVGAADVGPVQRDGSGTVSHPIRKCLGRIVVARVDGGDVGPLSHEPLRDRCADSPRPAGDDADPSGEPTHAGSLREHPLADDVALHLRRAGVDRVGPAEQERVLQVVQQRRAVFAERCLGAEHVDGQLAEVLVPL